MLVLSVASLIVLAYVYAGYPLLLRVLVALRGAKRVESRDITPALTLVISAYNEAAVIRKKLENALSLDYPHSALEIVVISDASTDETDAIVTEYAARGVKLIRQPERRGKTAGLNRAVPHLVGEIIVFSDANAIYKQDALRKLARNFADPAVGCVTGEARYVPGSKATADVGERAYWNYEMQVKRLETALGSMVGGDGAIYAIRRTLWRELPADAINDFLNPLQIVAAGWRAVYEPEAVCYEETAGRVTTEYRRRVRIVSRSWRAVFQAPRVLNPFAVGLFAWSVVSHKLLRWLSGAFALMVLGGLGTLVLDASSRWPLGSPVAAASGLVAVFGTHRGRRGAAMLGYFAAINAASLVGVVKGSSGRVSGVWSTPRQMGSASATRARPFMLPIGRGLLVGVILLGVLLAGSAVSSHRMAAMVFWVCLGLLAYVYVGYPLLLLLVRPVLDRPVRRGSLEPTVCLLVAANNEGRVIEAKLHNALALDYPADRLDIMVVSDGSTDETNAIVRRFAPRVRLLELGARRGKIAAINEGMRAVRSEIVVFSDANTFLEPGAICALVRNFADETVGAVSGDVALVGERAALGRSEDLYYRYERWVQRAESRIGSMIGADGALYAIRRELFAPPPNDTILDDMAIPMAVVQAGRRVVFDGGARALEQGAESAREEFSRKSRVIAGAIQFMRRPASDVPLTNGQVLFSLVSHKALRWWSPAFATGAFLGAAALASPFNVYAAAMTAQGVLIVFGLAGCVPALRRIGPIAIAHYFCLVQAAAAVGFVRGLCGRQSVLWRRFERAPMARERTAA